MISTTLKPFSVLLVIVSFFTTKTTYCQVNWTTPNAGINERSYTPQTPNNALVENLKYKQQLYDQRFDLLMKHNDYLLSLVSKIINTEVKRAYYRSCTETLTTIEKSDLTSSFYYDILTWYEQVETKAKYIIDSQ